MSDEIIFFGCWNKDGCDLESESSESSKSSLTSMIKGLNNFLTTKEEKPKHLVILGDNYYPKKEKIDGKKKKNI